MIRQNKWPFVHLSEVIADAQSGFASGERDPNGTIQLRMNNVTTNGQLVWHDFIRVPTDIRQRARYTLHEGDVVFNNTNSTELVGKSALFRGAEESIVYSNHFTRLRTIADQLIPEFLAIWLNGEWRKGTFARLCNQWIGQSAVKSDKLLALKIPLPPLPEQRRIAAILAEQMADVEQMRAAAEAELEAIQLLENAQIEPIYLSLTQNYSCQTLGSLVLEAGYGTSIKCDSIRSQESIPVLRIPNVISEKISLDDLKYGALVQSDIDRLTLLEGDVLIVRTNGSRNLVGRCAVVPRMEEPTAFASYLIRIRCKQDMIYAQYLHLILKYIRQNGQLIDSARTSVGQYNVSLGRLNPIQIPLPPIDEQKRIVNIAREQINEQRKAEFSTQKQITLINQLPAALLHKAFNGEL